MLKVGDKVQVPRTGGGYTEGIIIDIHGDRAVTEFPIGENYRGHPNPYGKNEMATKNVALKDLVPIKEEL